MRKLINWSEPRYSLISCSRFQTNTPDNFNSCCMQMSNMKENCILGNEENLGIGRERGILWVIRILGGTTGYYDLGYYTVGNTPRPDQMWGIMVGDCYSWLIIFWQDLGQLMQNTNKTIWKWQWQYWYRYQIIQFNETWLPTEKSLEEFDIIDIWNRFCHFYIGLIWIPLAFKLSSPHRTQKFLSNIFSRCVSTYAL